MVALMQQIAHSQAEVEHNPVDSLKWRPLLQLWSLPPGTASTKTSPRLHIQTNV
jgi:hypothetical protein